MDRPPRPRARARSARLRVPWPGMMAQNEPPRLARYAFALAVTLSSGAFYALVQPDREPGIFLLLFPAVVLSAWYGGLGPGVLSAFLSVGIADFLFYPPIGAFSFAWGAESIELAVFLGVALLVSSTVESLRRARREAEAARGREALVSEVAATLSGSGDYEEAFRDLARLLVRRMADYAVAYVVEGGETIRRIGVAHADRDHEPLVHELLDLRPPSLESLQGAGAVVRTGEAILATDITEGMLVSASEGDDAHRRVLLALGPVSSLIVPLGARGRTIGALALATTRRSDRRYDEDDLALAGEIASRAALVLDNARLLRDAKAEVRERRAAEAELRSRSAELEEATAELRNTLAELEIKRREAETARERAEASERRARELAEAGRLLSSGLEYGRTLERIARLAVEALGDVAAVDLVEGGSVRRLAVAHRDASRQSLAEAFERWPPDRDEEAGVGRALRTGEAIVVDEMAPGTLEAIARDADHHRVLLELAPHSLLIMPMIARGETIGAITVASCGASSRTWGEEDVRFARELADRAALAIDNARLFREAQSAVKLREEVLAVVSHDLRNLLSNLVITTHLLLEADPPPAKRQDLLSRELKVLGEADRLISDLLDVSQAEAGKLELRLRPSAAAELLHEAVSAFEDRARQSAVAVSGNAVDGLPAAFVDPDRTRRVLYNLLSNAIKFTPAGGRVEARCDRDGDRGLVFTVADSGPGIAPEDRPKLFESFWRSGRSRPAGTGLGLAIARTLVEAQGGRIWLETSSDSGSTFCFSVPMATPDTTTAPTQVEEAMVAEPHERDGASSAGRGPEAVDGSGRPVVLPPDPIDGSRLDAGSPPDPARPPA